MDVRDFNPLTDVNQNTIGYIATCQGSGVSSKNHLWLARRQTPVQKLLSTFAAFAPKSIESFWTTGQIATMHNNHH